MQELSAEEAVVASQASPQMGVLTVLRSQCGREKRRPTTTERRPRGGTWVF